MGKSTEEFINEILEAELGNHSMLVDIREKIRLGKHLSSYEERYLNMLKRQTKNDHILELPKKSKPKISYEKIKQKEQPKQPQEEITSAINEQQKLVAEKQKEFESHQTQIPSQQDLYQSMQKELVKMRTKLVTLLVQTDFQRKHLDEIKQHRSTHKLEEEYHELESELESKREEIVELKKQKQSVVQQTEQITQKVAEQEKQITEHTNLLLRSLEMLEEQKAGILEEITQEQAKKQSQENELQALTKEWLHQKSSNKNRQGIDEQIKKHRDNLHTIQNKCSLLELDIKSQMNLLDEERQKEKEIIMRITQKYN